MTRKELQLEVLSLFDKNNRIAVQWCTSLGKSKVAIDIIYHLLEKNSLNNSQPLKILLVVAETAHKNNWKEEFKKWKANMDNITIECYASLKKYRNSKWDLIIFDEAHHLGSDLRLDIISELKADNIVLLSATLPDQTVRAISDIFGEFAIHRVTLKQAIKWGILPEPKVYLIPLTLDDTDPHCIIREEWGKKELRVTHKCKFNERWEYLKNKEKYPNITLEIACTERQKYDYLSEQFEYWRKRFLSTRQEFIKNKWLQIGSKRKRFLGEIKTNSVYTLIQKLKKKRFICFCTSIEQAEILGGKNSIHSKKDNSLSIIDKFNTKRINNLFAVGMLQEGQNLTNIEAGIIVQLDGQERPFIQKFGRSLRAEDPIQFIFYYKDTRDSEYLKNILSGIAEEYIIEINDLNDLYI